MVVTFLDSRAIAVLCNLVDLRGVCGVSKKHTSHSVRSMQRWEVKDVAALAAVYEHFFNRTLEGSED